MSFEKEKKQPVDPWTTSQEGWEYVSIPEEDPLGTKFHSISLNKNYFDAGQTYKVPPPVAMFLRDRIKVYNKSCVRLLQPNVDLKSINEVQTGGARVAPSGDRPTFVDATKVQTL